MNKHCATEISDRNDSACKSVASMMGMLLKQSYEHRCGEWWLLNDGKPERPLRKEEVDWHTERHHKPFVSGGIDQCDPRWWDDPAATEQHKALK